MDEVQWHKGHKYQTVVYQLDEGRKRLLWIGRDRKAKTLLRFFRFLGKARTARLQFICSDMWQAYLKVIAKKAPQAVHVLDRFHIMQRMTMRTWLKRQIAELIDLQGQPEPDQAVYEDCASVVREAANRAAKVGLIDLYERYKNIRHRTPRDAVAILNTILAAAQPESDKC